MLEFMCTAMLEGRLPAWPPAGLGWGRVTHPLPGPAAEFGAWLWATLAGFVLPGGRMLDPDEVMGAPP